MAFPHGEAESPVLLSLLDWVSQNFQFDNHSEGLWILEGCWSFFSVHWEPEEGSSKNTGDGISRNSNREDELSSNSEAGGAGREKTNTFLPCRSLWALPEASAPFGIGLPTST